MKLLDYPGLFGKWPPPGHSLATPLRPAPISCVDILLLALHLHGALYETWEVCILSELEGENFVRRFSVGDDIIFATVFSEFLCKQRGKTIQEIGGIDVTFLG